MLLSEGYDDAKTQWCNNHTVTASRTLAKDFRLLVNRLRINSNSAEDTGLAADPAHYWLNLGEKLMGEKRWREAAEAFLTAHRSDLQKAGPISYLAVALLHVGRAAEAENLARRAVA